MQVVCEVTERVNLLAAALDLGAIMSDDDVNDVYHLLPFSGCSGELVEEFGLTCRLDGVWSCESSCDSTWAAPREPLSWPVKLRLMTHVAGWRICLTS